MAYFGVYDGHNGEYVADMLQARMHLTLLSNINAVNATIAETDIASTADMKGNSSLPILLLFPTTHKMQLSFLTVCMTGLSGVEYFEIRLTREMKIFQLLDS